MGLTTTILRSRAVAALASPQGVDRYLEQVNPMWAAHEVRARIVDVHREVDVPGHPPVATITLQPTSTWQGHRAGQHVQLGVEVDGARRTTRVFTISSPDSRSGDRFTVTLRANPDGVVSRFLVERAEPGTMVHLSQAQGEFVLPDQVPEHVLFISGGSGITPVMSMLRSLQRRTHRGRVTFVHYAQSPDAPDLRRRARADPALRPRHRPAPAAPRARRPEPLAGVPRAAGPGYRDVPTWACGPAPMIEAVRAAYDGVGDAPRRVLPAAAHFAARPPRATSPSAKSGQEAPNSGATLLEQAEALGLEPEFGCRMGICFSCTSVKRDGTRAQRPDRRGVLASRRGHPDLCQPRPCGDLHPRPLTSGERSEQRL